MEPSSKSPCRPVRASCLAARNSEPYLTASPAVFATQKIAIEAFGGDFGAPKERGRRLNRSNKKSCEVAESARSCCFAYCTGVVSAAASARVGLERHDVLAYHRFTSLVRLREVFYLPHYRARRPTRLFFTSLAVRNSSSLLERVSQARHAWLQDVVSPFFFTVCSTSYP